MQVKFQNNVTGAVDIIECTRVHYHVAQPKDGPKPEEGPFFTFDMHEKQGFFESICLGPTADYTIYVQNDNGKTVDTLQWQPQPVFEKAG